MNIPLALPLTVRLAVLLAVPLAAWGSVPPALAQLLLPGALRALPPAQSEKAAPNGAEPSDTAPVKSKPVAQKPPDASAIIGRDLSRDGSAGRLAFQAGAAKGLEITSLSIDGEEISHPGELCRVDVVAGVPIEAKAAGRPNGLARYDVDIEACPFSFEILEGAVLVSRTASPRSCDFSAADCRVDPTGLWGPQGDTIEERQIKNLERARAQAETSMRANFRALLANAGKDKAAIKKFAGEQAGFSSERTMICRDYAREEVHGLCGLRITQARTFALQSQHEAYSRGRADEKSAKATAEKKPKPLRSFRSQATDPQRAAPEP